jgi:hypothetical protein
MTGYLAWRNNEETIVPIATLANEVGGNFSAFTELTYGAITAWDTESAYISKKTLTVTGNTTISITNSVNGQVGVLLITATASSVITLKGYIAGDLVDFLTIPGGNSLQLNYVYDGTNYWWTGRSFGTALKNYITNPGFETGLLSPWVTPNNTDVTISTEARTGTYAASLTNYGLLSVTIGLLSPSTAYIFKLHMRCISGDNGTVFIGTGATENNYPITSIWTEYSINFTTSPSTSYTIYIYPGFETTVLVDDISITEDL